MSIITSKTEQSMRNQFGRRDFLKLSASTGFGVIVYSELGPISLAVGPPRMKPVPGWKDFFAGFAEFAANVGMLYLGSRVSEWLAKYPRWDSVVRNFARGLNSPYNPYGDYDQRGDQRTIYFPMYSESGPPIAPVFDRNDYSLGSRIIMPTGLALPQVAREFQAAGNDEGQRARLLIPRGSKGDSYNNLAQPERYRTDAGSAEFRFRGDQRGGDVHWTVWARGNGGSLQQIYRQGNAVVSFVS